MIVGIHWFVWSIWSSVQIICPYKNGWYACIQHGPYGILGRSWACINHQAVKCIVIFWDGASLEIYVMTHDHRKIYKNLLPRCHHLHIKKGGFRRTSPPSFFNFSARSWGSEYWNWGHRGYPLVLENLRYVPPTFWPSNRCQIPNALHLCLDLVVEVTVWLVVDLPLWKIWVRQLGWWHSQLNGKIKAMFQTTNQP